VDSEQLDTSEANNPVTSESLKRGAIEPHSIAESNEGRLEISTGGY